MKKWFILTIILVVTFVAASVIWYGNDTVCKPCIIEPGDEDKACPAICIGETRWTSWISSLS